VDTEIAMVENKTVKRVLVAICGHDVWDKAQKGLFGGCSNGAHGVVIVLPPNHVAYIPDCRFDLGREKSNTEVACRGDWDRKGLGLRVEKTLTEPASGEVEREVEVEQRCADLS